MCWNWRRNNGTVDYNSHQVRKAATFPGVEAKTLELILPGNARLISIAGDPRVLRSSRHRLSRCL